MSPPDRARCPPTASSPPHTTWPHRPACASWQEGGSAVAAANAVLQVVYPHNCSPGGDAFWLIYDPGQGHPVALNGSGRAPAAAELERLRERGLTQMPLHGPLPVTVPGAVDSWHEALRRFGRLGLERVLALAIAYAEDGFPATPGCATPSPSQPVCSRCRPPRLPCSYRTGGCHGRGSASAIPTWPPPTVRSCGRDTMRSIVGPSHSGGEIGGTAPSPC
jgi:hypothetical protein